MSIPVGAGAHQVCFGAVSGHSSPPCQLVMASAGSTTTVAGNFDGTTTYGYSGDGLRMSATNSGATISQTGDASGSLPLLLVERQPV